MENTKIKLLLEAMARRCRESEVDYEVAARETTDTDLRFLFSSYARQRARFVREWEGMLGGGVGGPESPHVPNSEGSDRGNETILAERAAAEEELLRAYEEILGLGLSDELRERLNYQCSEIRTAQARIGEVRELARPKAER